jgi:hypothetical protein
MGSSLAMFSRWVWRQVENCIVSMLRMEADAHLNRTTTNKEFLDALWRYQKSGAVLNEETLLREVILTLQKGRNVIIIAQT